MYFVGIDAGGTKTDFLLCDENEKQINYILPVCLLILVNLYWYISKVSSEFRCSSMNNHSKILNLCHLIG